MKYFYIFAAKTQILKSKSTSFSDYFLNTAYSCCRYVFPFILLFIVFSSKVNAQDIQSKPIEKPQPQNNLDQYIVSGGAIIIDVSKPDLNTESKIASKPLKHKQKIAKRKSKAIEKEKLCKININMPVSKKSYHNFPIRQSQSFIVMMTCKASGATPSQNIVALVPLHETLLHGASLLYSRINSALISTIAFKFSRRYTCRPPPTLA